MIRLTDATILAATKLRTHKLRTTVTILLASILFGVLIAVSLIIDGGLKSIDNFRSDGLTSHYIVNVNSAFNVNDLRGITRNADLIAEAKKAYIQLVEEKTREAKRLNISYNQASDQPPYMTASDNGGDMLVLSDTNGITQKVLAQKYSGSPAFDDTKLNTLARRYRAIGIFSAESYTITRGSSLEVFADGKEKFYDTSDMTAVNENYVTPILDTNLTILPSELTTPFLLPDNAGWTASSDALPVILPQDTIERLIGLDKLSAKASASAKLERLTTIKQQAASLTFDACYRDKASLDLIQQTVQQQAEMTAHANDTQYQKPSLIYALPDPAKCEGPSVVSDTRTSEQKKQDASRAIFDEEFNNKKEPISYFVHFKVVGVSPERTSSLQGGAPTTTTANVSNVSDIINNLLATNGVEQAIPKVLYDQIPNKTRYADLFTYTPLYLFGNEDNKIRYIEFSNAQDAQMFIDEQSCTMQYDNTCKPLGRTYQASLSFSNSAALDDLREKSTQLFQIITLGVMLLATLIMWIAVSRTISDSRRETAVFRAIGFGRMDIAALYITYTLLLCFFIIALSIGIGFIGAHIVDAQLAPQLTAQAQYGFGGIDLTKKVSLVGINKDQFLPIVIACLATGILSVMFPLLRNVRRNPVRDMRDE